MSLTIIGMWESRRRKTPCLWQIDRSMCTKNILDLLAAKGLTVKEGLQYMSNINDVMFLLFTSFSDNNHGINFHCKRAQ